MLGINGGGRGELFISFLVRGIEVSRSGRMGWKDERGTHEAGGPGDGD